MIVSSNGQLLPLHYCDISSQAQEEIDIIKEFHLSKFDSIRFISVQSYETVNFIECARYRSFLMRRSEDIPVVIENINKNNTKLKKLSNLHQVYILIKNNNVLHYMIKTVFTQDIFFHPLKVFYIVVAEAINNEEQIKTHLLKELKFFETYQNAGIIITINGKLMIYCVDPYKKIISKLSNTFKTPDNYFNVNGDVLKVAVFGKNNVDTKIYATETVLSNLMAYYINATLEIKSYRYREYRKLSDDIINERLNVSLARMHYNNLQPSNKKSFVPIRIDSYIVVIVNPEIIMSFRYVGSVFDWKLFLVFDIYMIVTFLILQCSTSQRLLPENHPDYKKNKAVSELVLIGICLNVSQPNLHKYRFLTRIILYTWISFTSYFTMAVTANMKTDVIDSQPKYVIEDLPDLLNSSLDIFIWNVDRTMTQNLYQDTSLPFGGRIRGVYNIVEHILQNNDTKAYILSKQLAYNVMRATYKQRTYQRLKKKLMWGYAGYEFPKLSPYGYLLWKFSNIIDEHGLSNYGRETLNHWKFLQNMEQQSGNFKPMTIENVMGALVILCLGFVVAFGVLIIENVVFYIKKKYLRGNWKC